MVSPGWKCARLSDAGSSCLVGFYGIRGVSFTALRRELGWLGDAPHPEEELLSRAIGSALLHGDDPDPLRALAAALSAPAPPELHTLAERERRAWLMLTVYQYCFAEAWRLRHRPPMASTGRRPGRREGVLWHQPTATDLLFITLRKSEALSSPTTRYRDLALGPCLFHWESQSTTTAASPTGQRYIHHAARGSRVLLFVREQRRVDGRSGGVTEPFRCLGFAR